MGGGARNGAAHGLLAMLPADERERLVRGARLRRFAAGDHLLRQGAPGDGVLVVRSGTLKVVAVRNGERFVVALRGEGEVVGELATLDGRPRWADVIACGAGEALEIDGDSFRAAFSNGHSARRHITAALTERVREVTDEWIQASSRDLTARMAHRLLQLADRFGTDADDGSLTIDPPITRAELASWAGGSRGAGARALGTLRATGWVETAGRAIVIRDRDALEHFAGRSVEPALRTAQNRMLWM